MTVIKHIAYLVSSTNDDFNVRLDNGEEMIGTLEIDSTSNEMAFTSGDRIAFRFTEYMENSDKDELLLSDGNEYYIFSKNRPKRIE